MRVSGSTDETDSSGAAPSTPVGMRKANSAPELLRTAIADTVSMTPGLTLIQRFHQPCNLATSSLFILRTSKHADPNR